MLRLLVVADLGTKVGPDREEATSVPTGVKVRWMVERVSGRDGWM